MSLLIETIHAPPMEGSEPHTVVVLREGPLAERGSPGLDRFHGSLAGSNADAGLLPRDALFREEPATEDGIAVVGLGYVGLPVALALSRRWSAAGTPVLGFDASAVRREELRRGFDKTGEVARERLLDAGLALVDDPGALRSCSFFIVAVPTPIDQHNRPDLRPLVGACRAIGPSLRRGAVVVFESTVYPGVTREICGPALAEASGLRQGVDFKLGYSPERIVPGDADHRLETITKVVSGEDEETLERVAGIYGEVIKAGLHRAPSLEVAEAAKVIENTQRDLNIALMNELALIFDRLGLCVRDVLAAARTKWNFLPFTPGLVGGHCIGVDPYYLAAKAEAMGYHPHVILSGRRVNDAMGAFIAQRLVRMLIEAGRPVRAARVGILGLAFKENVPDIRNSRVPDIVRELRTFGVEAAVCDPFACPEEACREYGLSLVEPDALRDLDALVLAVPHARFTRAPAALFATLSPGGALLDVKGCLDRQAVPAGLTYWTP